MQQPQRGAVRRGWYWLLLVPYIFMLWVPSFNSMDPKIAGIPFFYWYQFVWIAGTAIVTWVAYLLAHRGQK